MTELENEYPLRKKLISELDKVNTLPNNKIRSKAQNRILKKYANRMEKVGPMPWHFNYIRECVAEFEELHSDKQLKEARLLFCWAMDGLAWFSGAPRYPYIKFFQEDGAFEDLTLPFYRLIEMAHPKGIGTPFSTLSRDVFKGWFEEYDLPNIKDIDMDITSNGGYFTEPELVVMAREGLLPGVPKTLQGLRKKAKAENWNNSPYARRRKPD
ncbi:MAG: hypothetical protein OQJ97_10110 [Rhodospirillales bacterium]|nr:hypothetical protein [Rhodospirillales bacterium]